MSAWERAANAAEENPKYHSLIDTTAEQDDVDFMEDGSSPVPLSEPEFIDMTEEDEASIKGAA